MYEINSEIELKFYEKKLRRLDRLIDLYMEPYLFFSYYPVNRRVLIDYGKVLFSIDNFLSDKKDLSFYEH